MKCRDKSWRKSFRIPFLATRPRTLHTSRQGQSGNYRLPFILISSIFLRFRHSANGTLALQMKINSVTLQLFSVARIKSMFKLLFFVCPWMWPRRFVFKSQQSIAAKFIQRWGKNCNSVISTPNEEAFETGWNSIWFVNDLFARWFFRFRFSIFRWRSSGKLKKWFSSLNVYIGA